MYLFIQLSCVDWLIDCLFPFTLLSFLQGKFIRINFDVAGYIVGANIETCILLVRKWNSDFCRQRAESDLFILFKGFISHLNHAKQMPKAASKV